MYTSYMWYCSCCWTKMQHTSNETNTPIHSYANNNNVHPSLMSSMTVRVFDDSVTVWWAACASWGALWLTFPWGWMNHGWWSDWESGTNIHMTWHDMRGMIKPRLQSLRRQLIDSSYFLIEQYLKQHLRMYSLINKGLILFSKIFI